MCHRREIDEVSGSESSSANLPRNKVTVAVHVSSSVIDLTVVMQRIVGFASTLCQTFYKIRRENRTDFEASLSSTVSSEDSFGYRNAEMRRKLYDNFLEVGVLKGRCLKLKNCPKLEQLK